MIRKKEIHFRFQQPKIYKNPIKLLKRLFHRRPGLYNNLYHTSNIRLFGCFKIMGQVETQYSPNKFINKIK